MSDLPVIEYKKIKGTRDFLQDVAKVLSRFQQVFIPDDEHQWQWGLEIIESGLSTQSFIVRGDETRVVLDMEEGCVRIDYVWWSLAEFTAPEILDRLQLWLEDHGVTKAITAPKFLSNSEFKLEYSQELYAVLRLIQSQFEKVRIELKTGLASPIYFYPHHFDLSLVWFPHEDKRQISVGFSTGDETIAKPYLYMTANPEPQGFHDLKLTNGAYWQKDGFSGAVLPYEQLKTAHDVSQFGALMLKAKQLL